MEPVTTLPDSDPKLLRLMPQHPLPNPKNFAELTQRGETIETPLGTFDMARLEINPDRLSEDMARISADIGWFRGYEVAAGLVVRTTELNLKRKQAELSQVWQQRKADGERLTVSDIDHNISLDSEVQELEDQLTHARYNLELLQALRMAHETKSRQLQSAVGLYRTETDADMHRYQREVVREARNEGDTR